MDKRLKTIEDNLTYFRTLALDCDESKLGRILVDEFDDIQKDLDILEDFKKLFDGEDLDSWIEFDFNVDNVPENSLDNYNGYISLCKRIKEYLKNAR